MPQPFLNSLITLPGMILLHLCLGVCTGAALLVAYRFQSGSFAPLHSRKILALWIVLGLQAASLVAAGLAGAGLFDSRLILPPLYRLLLTLSLAWLAWAWLQNDHPHLRNYILGAVHAGCFILLAFTYLGWSREMVRYTFNDTWFYLFWELFFLGIVIISGALITARRPSAWKSGLAFMAVQIAGIMADLFINHSPQDYSVPIRLAQLVAFPLLVGLPRREEASLPQPVSSPHPITRERRRYATDQKTFLAALKMAVEGRPEQLATSLTRFAAHMLVADLAYLVAAPDSSGEVIIEGGFDLINEEPWPGASIPASRIPDIAEALISGVPLRIEKSSPSGADLAAVADALDINETGNLMLVPLVHEVNGPLGGLLLLSAYSQRVWSQADLDYVMPGTAHLVQILHKRLALSPGERHENGSAALHSGELFSLLETESGSGDSSSHNHSASDREALDNLREENQRLLAALEAAQQGEGSAGLQHLHELEEALYYANLRIERLEKAAPPPAKTGASLPSLIEPALVLASNLTGHKHVTMRIDIPQNLPALLSEPEALKEVLTMALQKALEDTASEGTIVLKAQAGANPDGEAHVHLKVISSGTPRGQAAGFPEQIQGLGAVLIEKASAIMTAQAGRLWVDPLAGGAVVTNVIMPAILERKIESPAQPDGSQ